MNKSINSTTTAVVKADPKTTTSSEETPRVQLGDGLSPWFEAPKVRLGDGLMPW